MTKIEQSVNNLFRQMRDYRVEKLGISTRDAASDLQEFMRDCCTEYNFETYEREPISNSRTLQMLRQKFKRDKKYFSKLSA